jgi:hypothetical protein
MPCERRRNVTGLPSLVHGKNINGEIPLTEIAAARISSYSGNAV